MKPAPFTRHVPKTLDEAVKMLAEVAPQDGRVLAGGQSLVPIMAFRLAKPAHLVDINNVEGLDRITVENGALIVRALARHAAFHKVVADNPLGHLLTKVAHSHRALSDPHARHVLRQPRARRSVVRMVPRRRDARRDDHCQKRARRARDSPRGIFSKA